MVMRFCSDNVFFKRFSDYLVMANKWCMGGRSSKVDGGICATVDLNEPFPPFSFGISNGEPNTIDGFVDGCSEYFKKNKKEAYSVIVDASNSSLIQKLFDRGGMLLSRQSVMLACRSNHRYPSYGVICASPKQNEIDDFIELRRIAFNYDTPQDHFINYSADEFPDMKLSYIKNNSGIMISGAIHVDLDIVRIIDHVATHPNFRNQGLGTKVIKSACFSSLLPVFLTSTGEATNLYRNVGFEEIGVIDFYLLGTAN